MNFSGMFSHELYYSLQFDDRLVFLHIPQTIDPIVYDLLDEHFARRDIFPLTAQHQIDNFDGDISQYHLFRGYFDYQISNYLQHNPIYMTFLRDPVKRVISEYLHQMRCTKQTAPLFQDTDDLFDMRQSLNTFVNNSPYYIPNHQVVSLSSAFTQDASYEIRLEIAKHNLSKMKFFGITDRIDDSLMLLYYTFCWQPKVLFSTSSRIMAEQVEIQDVDNNIINMIREQNKYDIQLYDYALELFQDRLRIMQTDLLTKHYRQMVQHPRKSRVKIDFANDVFDGIGWHPREIGGCWTGPETTSTLYLPLNTVNPLSFQLFVNRKIHPDIVQTLKIYVNQHHIPLLNQPTTDAVFDVIQGELPIEVLQTDEYTTCFEFYVDYTMTFHNSTSQDKNDTQRGILMRYLMIDDVT